jgi:ubiquinone/menaquinone biosynthesis C-methylase UbiE
MNTSDTTRERVPAGSPYLLDNAGREAPARFNALTALFDSGTIRHFENCGVGSGWQCLEIGGGGGSITSWLAARVGSTGRVVATDIDPRFLKALNHPHVEVWQHNIVSDPLPEAAFDLVHARLVLIHVPQREEVLRRMISALKPGGWLLSEEFDSASLIPDPEVNPGETLLKTHIAMFRSMESHGVERRFGRFLLHRFRTYGLLNPAAEGRIFMWQANSPGASLMRANYEQLRDDMIDGGYITEQQFNQDLARMQEPDFMMPSAILWSAWGRRP